jgi:hypothetical protein
LPALLGERLKGRKCALTGVLVPFAAQDLHDGRYTACSGLFVKQIERLVLRKALGGRLQVRSGATTSRRSSWDLVSPVFSARASNLATCEAGMRIVKCSVFSRAMSGVPVRFRMFSEPTTGRSLGSVLTVSDLPPRWIRVSRSARSGLRFYSPEKTRLACLPRLSAFELLPTPFHLGSLCRLGSFSHAASSSHLICAGC